MAFSPDGRTLATAHGGRETRLWDVNTGDQTHTLPVGTTGNRSVAFSPDGTILATGGQARFWDTATGEPVKLLKDNPDSVSAIAFSPDGELLASAGKDSTVRLTPMP
ncbi:hypothetical protein GCM10009736_35220 [Actinomadura bangladeshensis]